MTLMTLFAVLAGALAATGIYGVMSYVVTQARREIGIRLALGARPIQVRTRVLRQGLGVVAIGAAIGLAGAWSLSGLLEKQLFQITTGDPGAYIAAAVGLLIVAAVACWLPATRTTRIDPAAVLRD
jgi:ABC-type antimicrobial peptide transport system permease subunit